MYFIYGNPGFQTLAGKRWLVLVLLYQIFLLCCCVRGEKLPEVPSTLLKLHKIYTTHPPHDSSFYDVLRVSPNATSAQVQKSYRKLMRMYHPDKQRNGNTKMDGSTDSEKQRMEKIQQAYDILKSDSTRLPYHKYGLLDLQTAVLVLTGFQNTPKIPTRQQVELLRLMGYNHDSSEYHPPQVFIGRTHYHAHRHHHRHHHQQQQHLSQEQQEEQRIWFLAATILEKVRPMVEGTINERTLADRVAQECDRLKTLPLGAQIIRCVGRAYRHSGRRFLRQQQQQQQTKTWSVESVRDKWHDAKHLVTAAMASGRAILKEPNLLRSMRRKKKNTRNMEKGTNPVPISYYWEATTGGHVDDDDHLSIGYNEGQDGVPTDKELQTEEAEKARKIIIELLQVEALWKVHKIGLHRTVRDACDLILDGQYFFFPSHQSTNPSRAISGGQQEGDGWVSSATNYQPSGQTIDANTAKLHAAAALVLIGDIMVQCSKEGTAWME